MYEFRFGQRARVCIFESNGVLLQCDLQLGIMCRRTYRCLLDHIYKETERGVGGWGPTPLFSAPASSYTFTVHQSPQM